MLRCKVAPPTGSCLHREAKPLTFLLVSAQGVLHTASVLRLPETQSGGADRSWAEEGASFLMSGLRRDVKMGLLNLTWLAFSLWEYSWEIHNGMEIIWAETTLGKEVRVWNEKRKSRSVTPALQTSIFQIFTVGPFISPQLTMFKNIKIFDFPYRYANCLCVLTWSRGCVALAAPWHVTACTFSLGRAAVLDSFCSQSPSERWTFARVCLKWSACFLRKCEWVRGGGLLSFPFFLRTNS